MQNYVEPFLGCRRDEMLGEQGEIVIAHGEFVSSVAVSLT